MIRQMTLALGLAVGMVAFGLAAEAQAQQAYGQSWGRTYNTRDWERFYHYPYVYYPQNFWGGEYYRSSENMYHRYPPEMRIPVYNRQWHNYYPGTPRYGNKVVPRRYHSGHQFVLDVF